MSKSMLSIFGLMLASAIASCAIAGNAGQAIYETHCSVCHGIDGKGTLPGMPDFTKKKGVLSLPVALLVKRVANGYQGPDSPMAMPPRGGDASLTNRQIKQVLRYVRRKFGG